MSTTRSPASWRRSRSSRTLGQVSIATRAVPFTRAQASPPAPSPSPRLARKLWLHDPSPRASCCVLVAPAAGPRNWRPGRCRHANLCLSRHSRLPCNHRRPRDQLCRPPHNLGRSLSLLPRLPHRNTSGTHHPALAGRHPRRLPLRALRRRKSRRQRCCTTSTATSPTSCRFGRARLCRSCPRKEMVSDTSHVMLAHIS